MQQKKINNSNQAENIHPLADVQSTSIGEDTTIWQYSVVLPGAVIGSHCNIAAHSFIENDVVIGDNVTIKSGVYVWDGVRLEDDVFVGPAVVFTNDKRPRSKNYKSHQLSTIKRGASLGANTSILAGVTVGEYAMTGMGSVVTRNVPAYALVYGNPARIKAWVDKKGRKLILQKSNLWHDEDGNSWLLKRDKMTFIGQGELILR